MKLRKSFYVRFAFYFFLVLAASTLINIVFVWANCFYLAANVYQRTNWDLAAEFAHSVSELLQPEADRESLRIAIAEFQRTHPGTTPFLTDLNGRVIGSDKQLYFDPEILERATQKTLPELPILIEHPELESRFAPFSIYKSDVFGEPGYVMILLHSANLDFIWRTQGAEYLQFYFLVVFSLVVLTAFIIGISLFYYLSKNFRKILSVVDTLARGDFSNRIELSGDDEIAGLGNAIDTMADRLEAAYEKIEQNDNLRRRLITDIFHDLRTPLTSLNGFISAASDRALQYNDPLLSEHLADATKSLKRQSTLVADVFELTKMQAREKQALLEEFSYSELLQDTVISLEGVARDKGVALKIEADEQQAFVIADIEMSARVLQNLIGNAIKYTDKGGTVTVRLEKDKTQLLVDVIDTGNGIPADQLDSIFEPFTRVDEARDRDLGGTGLGLAIVHHMLEAQGSKIQVESKAGHGSTFSFKLQLVTQA